MLSKMNTSMISVPFLSTEVFLCIKPSARADISRTFDVEMPAGQPLAVPQIGAFGPRFTRANRTPG